VNTNNNINNTNISFFTDQQRENSSNSESSKRKNTGRSSNSNNMSHSIHLLATSTTDSQPKRIKTSAKREESSLDNSHNDPSHSFTLTNEVGLSSLNPTMNENDEDSYYSQNNNDNNNSLENYFDYLATHSPEKGKNKKHEDVSSHKNTNNRVNYFEDNSEIIKRNNLNNRMAHKIQQASRNNNRSNANDDDLNLERGMNDPISHSNSPICNRGTPTSNSDVQSDENIQEDSNTSITPIILNKEDAGSLKFLPAALLSDFLSKYLDFPSCHGLSQVNKFYSHSIYGNPFFTTIAFMHTPTAKQKRQIWTSRFNSISSLNSWEVSLDVKKKAQARLCSAIHDQLQKHRKFLSKIENLLKKLIHYPETDESSKLPQEAQEEKIKMHRLGCNLLIENEGLYNLSSKILKFADENFIEDPKNRHILLKYHHLYGKFPDNVPSSIVTEIEPILKVTKQLGNGHFSTVFTKLPAAKSDKQILLFAINHLQHLFKDESLCELDSSMKNDIEVWEALAECYVTLKEAPQHIRANKKIVLKMLSRMNVSMEGFGADYEELLRSIDPSLFKDRDIITTVLEKFKDCEKVLRLLDLKKHCNQRGFALMLVEIHGGFLQYLDQDFQNDRGIVYEAVCQSSSALQYASSKLRQDPLFILNLFKKGKSSKKGDLIKFALPSVYKHLMPEVLNYIEGSDKKSNAEREDCEALFYYLNHYISSKPSGLKYRFYQAVFDFHQKTPSKILNLLLQSMDLDPIFLSFLLNYIKAQPNRASNLPKQIYKNREIAALIIQKYEAGHNPITISTILDNLGDFIFCFDQAKRFYKELEEDSKRLDLPSFVNKQIRAIANFPSLFKIPDFLLQTKKLVDNPEFMTLAIKHTLFYEKCSLYPNLNFSPQQQLYIDDKNKEIWKIYSLMLLNMMDERPDLLEYAPPDFKTLPEIQKKLKEKEEREAAERNEQLQVQVIEPLRFNPPVTALFDPSQENQSNGDL
jgi:hypothetical protein